MFTHNLAEPTRYDPVRLSAASDDGEDVVEPAPRFPAPSRPLTGRCGEDVRPHAEQALLRVLDADTHPGDVIGVEGSTPLLAELQGGQAGPNIIVRLLAERQDCGEVRQEFLLVGDLLEPGGQPVGRRGREGDDEGHLLQRAQRRDVQLVANTNDRAQNLHGLLLL